MKFLKSHFKSNSLNSYGTIKDLPPNPSCQDFVLASLYTIEVNADKTVITTLTVAHWSVFVISQSLHAQIPKFTTAAIEVLTYTSMMQKCFKLSQNTQEINFEDLIIIKVKQNYGLKN